MAANVSQDDLQRGNITNMPSPAVLRKAASEARQEQHFSSHPLLDLYEYGRFLSQDCKGGNAENYIRDIITSPSGKIVIHLYSQLMVTSYHRLAETKSLFLHLDATGSVIIRPSEICSTAPIYYYVLVAATENRAEPLAEMISNDHSWVTIEGWLNQFADATRKNNSKIIYPQKVEMDFSWALLIAVMRAFNSCNVIEYVNRCYNLEMQNKPFPTERTVVHLCAAHMIHSVSRRLTKHGRKYTPIQFKAAMRSFAILQNSTSMGEVDNAYRNIYLLFNRRWNCLDTVIAVEYIQSAMPEAEMILPEEFPNDDVESLPAWKEDRASLRESSSFTKHFDSLQQVLLGEFDNGSETNAFYSPELFKLIVKDLYLYPLWSGIIIKRFGRTRDTNACVEDWMRHMKNDVLKGKRLSIKEYVRKTLQWTTNRICTIRNEQLVSKKQKCIEPESRPECWQRRRNANQGCHYQPRIQLQGNSTQNRPIPLPLDMWSIGFPIDPDNLLDGDMFTQAKGAVYAPTKAYDLDPEIRALNPAYRADQIWPENTTSIDNGRNSNSGVWLPSLNLGPQELDILSSKQWITSEIVLATMKVLRNQFPQINGLLPTFFVEHLNFAIRGGTFVQILHSTQPEHWLLVKSDDSTKKTLLIFDSLACEPSPLPSIPEQIASLLRTPHDRFTIKTSWCPQQSNGYSCGDHAIANLVQLLFEQSALDNHDWIWNEMQLRPHLIKYYSFFNSLQ